MRNLITTAAAPVLLLTSCLGPDLTVAPRETDSTSRLFESPLLLELPADAPYTGAVAAEEAIVIGGDERFSFQFRDTSLRAAFEILAIEAGVSLVPDASVQGVVDLDFHDVTVDEAVQTLLAQHDLAVVRGPGSILMIERNDDPKIVTEYLRLANVRSNEVAPNLTALVGGATKILSDDDRNVICVVGPRSDVIAVRRYLQNVDRLKDQVLVEVHIFEVSYDDGFELGALHDVAGTVNGNAFNVLSAFGNGNDFNLTLTDDDGDLQSTVDAVRSFVGLELISSPRILAVTNTKASVDVVREIPYVETTSTTTGTTAGVGSTIQEAVQFKEAGIKLEITPSIQEAGYLQVDILQSILEEVDRFNDIPVVDRRTLTTQFLVKDRETIVLGGLIQESQSESKRGVPFLMHIPVLGHLFRSDVERKRKSELLLFVTPRILSPSQAAKLAPHISAEYRDTRDEIVFPRSNSDR